MDIINADGIDESYGTYVDDECFHIHGYDDPDDDTEGRCGNLCSIKAQESRL